MFTVSDLANKAQVSPDTVRHYVKVGLLHPGRHADNSYKIFTQNDINLVQFIRNAKYLGLTLKEISEIVNQSEEDNGPCPRVREILTQHIDKNRKKLNGMSMLQYQMERALLQWEDMPDGIPDRASVYHLIESGAKGGMVKSDASKCYICDGKLKDTHYICKKNNLFYYFCSKSCCNSLASQFDNMQDASLEPEESIESRTIYLEEPLSEEVIGLVRTILSKLTGISGVSINDSNIFVAYDINKVEKMKMKEAINEIEIALKNQWFDILRHRLVQLTV